MHTSLHDLPYAPWFLVQKQLELCTVYWPKPEVGGNAKVAVVVADQIQAGKTGRVCFLLHLLGMMCACTSSTQHLGAESGSHR